MPSDRLRVSGPPGGRARPRSGERGELEPAAAAAAVAELFPAIYLRLHRRRKKRGLRADGAMLAVMGHLSMAGPLTVTEAARHMDRAQSVMSELVDRLVAHGLVERMPDARDRRRVLVWLTDAGEEALRAEREVLSRGLLTAALERMARADRRALLHGMRALVAAAGTLKIEDLDERSEP
jgi:DNA-binding MarR family transcriptional regulator